MSKDHEDRKETDFLNLPPGADMPERLQATSSTFDVANQQLEMHIDNHMVRISIEGDMFVGRSIEGDMSQIDIDLSQQGAYQHGVSRRHAVIRYHDDALYVEDLKSTNGTYLNGKYMTWKSGLNHRDRITIGRHVLVFHEEGGDKGSPDDACQTVFISPADLKKK